MSINFPIRRFKVWSRGGRESGIVSAKFMQVAVTQFAGVHVLHLHGSASLSTSSNTVEWITSDGSARQFTAYELHD